MPTRSMIYEPRHSILITLRLPAARLSLSTVTTGFLLKVAVSAAASAREVQQKQVNALLMREVLAETAAQTGCTTIADNWKR